MTRKDLTPSPADAIAALPDGPVYFWQVDGTPVEIFSQWYPSVFTDDTGVEHSCTEMYMMHRKALLFGDADSAAKILRATKPFDMQRLGRQVKNYDGDTWDKHKLEIVTEANVLKFTQSVAKDGTTLLKDLLLATGERELVEASPRDRIWGIGYSPSDAPTSPRGKWGSNLLGQALMAVRDKIR